MSKHLDVGDLLIDRDKASLYLYYFARATGNVLKREFARRKVEVAIKQLKKLSTKELSGHVDALEVHIREALQHERAIQGQQNAEESTHRSLNSRIHVLDQKLDRYLKTQEARASRVKELEEKIADKFKSSRLKQTELKEQYHQLLVLYNAAKSTNVDKKKLLQIAKRLEQVKKRLEKKS